jgi:hypothetical protein
MEGLENLHLNCGEAGVLDNSKNQIFVSRQNVENQVAEIKISILKWKMHVYHQEII